MNSLGTNKQRQINTWRCSFKINLVIMEEPEHHQVLTFQQTV